MNISNHDTRKQVRTQVRAVDAQFDATTLSVSLSDGRVISLPVDKIAWLGWLAKATPEQQQRWSIEPGGSAIYWDELDDGVEVCHLLEMVALA